MEQKTINWMKDNIDILLDDYDLKKLRRDLNIRYLRKYYKVYPDERGTILKSINLNLDQDITFLVENLKSQIIVNFKTIDIFNICNNFTLVRWYYFKKLNNNYYCRDNYCFNSLFNVLLYAKDSIFLNDLSKANAICDKYNINSNSFHGYKGYIEELGINLKVFKNGRIDIKFNNGAHKIQFDSIIDILTEYRNK